MFRRDAPEEPTIELRFGTPRRGTEGRVSDTASELRQAIQSGEMTRQEALDQLTSGGGLTQTGAQDVLDNT